MKKMITLLAVVLMACASSLFATDFLVGGFIPLINSVSPVGVVNLDFANAQTDVTIAKVIVNNNMPTGWKIATTFSNSDVNFSGPGTSVIAGSDFQWVEAAENTTAWPDGTLTEPTTLAPLAIDPTVDGQAVLALTDVSAPTQNYIFDMQATWATPTAFTGFYQKTITLVIGAN